VRYDELFARLTERAIGGAALDLDTFFENAIAMGMDPEVVEQQLLDDLERGGPIFGKFLRSVTGAAEASSVQAERQGQFVGATQFDNEVQALLDFDPVEFDRMIDEGDAEALDAVEATAGEVVDMIWVAELINTCEFCLPLHGVRRTAREWESLGLHPSTRHQQLGWNSICHCHLIPSKDLSDNEPFIAPLKRIPDKTVTGKKIARKTRRSIMQDDIDKSRAAVEKAKDSIEGRRLLRLMGMANTTEE